MFIPSILDPTPRPAEKIQVTGESASELEEGGG